MRQFIRDGVVAQLYSVLLRFRWLVCCRWLSGALFCLSLQLSPGGALPGAPPTAYFGCVVTTVRRRVCFSEKSRTHAAKEAALSAHATVALPLLHSELKRELRQFPLKTAC